MKKLNITKTKILITGTIFIFTASLLVAVNNSTGKVTAIASGCSSSRPTAIRGSIKAYGGDYNNWSTKAFIGIDLLNSNKKKVGPAGNRKTTSGYSHTITVNPSLSQPGSATVLDQTYGLCVSSKVKTAWIEVYPKDENGATNYTYLGGAADHNRKVKAGVINNFPMRLPTSFTYNGNTGDVNGYVRYKNKAINPSNLKFRAFPYLAGSACGVQGFSASASKLTSGGSKNYYKIINLAAGQCGSAKQRYRITATCTNKCGASKRTILKYVYVAKGARPRVDFKF
ncbi:MAG TPA: hypothetical protein VFX79_02460 [Candidatus Saccharimonadales bacterium]|nr:hypothetical protein [Candidatus Saccharimonadales bacterium]